MDIWTDDVINGKVNSSRSPAQKDRRLEISHWRRMVELDENGRS